MKVNVIILSVIVFFSLGTVFGQNSKKQKTIKGKICGNPKIKCKTDNSLFTDSDIQFELPKNYIVYESEAFYIVVLKSSKVADRFGDEATCKPVANESERKNVQELFPNNKVFAQNCGFGAINYSEDAVFLAVFAGRTLAQAKLFLKSVDQTGKFKGAYIKRIHVEFNGT